MQPSHVSIRALRNSLLAAGLSAVLGAGMPPPVMAQTDIPLAPFKSVTLRGGGEVILRHASAQRVTLLEGSTEYSAPTIAKDGQLVIEKCRSDCPKGYELVIEVSTPEIAGVMVMDGGTIRSSGSFPPQAEIGAGVADGGTIDLRSMTVDFVAATVQDGGRIFTTPQRGLVARVAHGGVITYWGSPRLTSSVKQGGIVGRGAAVDADKPLREFGPSVPLPPPVPVIPPLTPMRGRGTF